MEHLIMEVTPNATTGGYDGTFTIGINAPTGIDEPEIEPGGFELQQNYPNPFNPVTTIRYHLPVNSEVDLRVYDALGHEVAVLVGEKQPAGTREIVFDAANLSSGFYFYRLVAQFGGQPDGSFAQTREMLLIR